LDVCPDSGHSPPRRGSQRENRARWHWPRRFCWHRPPGPRDIASLRRATAGTAIATAGPVLRRPAEGSPTAADAAAERRRQLFTVHTPGWALITALTVVATWGDRDAVLIIAVGELILVPFNVWASLRLRTLVTPARAELVRMTGNVIGLVAVAHLTGWPLPVWFRLTYVALAFDHHGRRTSVAAFIAFCVIYDVAALLDGVVWTLPASFTVIAVYCSRVSHDRTRVIRTMLVRSDRQRDALAQAHGELSGANGRLVTALAARAEMELELRQAQKLEAIGRLAAGIAHEINTPAQFVGDNVEFSRDAGDDLLGLVDTYRAGLGAIADGADAGEIASLVARAEAAADLSYLREYLPRSFEETLEGVGRIAAIVRSVKTFAHPDHHEVAAIDLNEAIRSTLTMARSGYKDAADVVTTLGELPPVTGNGGEVNQVLLNLVINAADAIASAGRGRGLITVRSWAAGDAVLVSVTDDGTGIPDDVAGRIFDPFFTTKEVGRGTGQGLAIASSVARKHGGTLTFATELGVGTTFTLRLPVAEPAAQAA
jgi:signal transduction histidine kinase